MDKSIDLQVVISAVDEASSKLEGIGKSAQSLGKTFAVVGGVMATALGFATKSAIEAEAQQNRLTHILQTSRGATLDQIDVLLKQAKALEKVGVASEGSIVTTQAQLATFDLQVDTIERLTPAILDYVVAEKGASASTEEFKALTNGLAQALQGNFASLTRTGFVLDDATKALISTGTEAEKSRAIVEVLNSTYKGFNESARATAEGGLVALRNNMGQLSQTIGEVLLPILAELTGKLIPVIDRIMAWTEENPKLTQVIVLVTAGIAGLLLVLAPLLIMLPALITFFTLLTPTVFIVIGILAGLVVSVTNVVKIFQLLRDESDVIWEGIKITIRDAINNIVGFFQPLFNVIDRVKSALASIKESVSSKVSSVVASVKTKISGARAEGGPVEAGKSYLVGERGAEIFSPSGSGFITPNGAMAGGLTININGGTYLSESVAEDIGDLIIQRFKKISKLSY